MLYSSKANQNNVDSLNNPDSDVILGQCRTYSRKWTNVPEKTTLADRNAIAWIDSNLRNADYRPRSTSKSGALNRSRSNNSRSDGVIFVRSSSRPGSRRRVDDYIPTKEIITGNDKQMDRHKTLTSFNSSNGASRISSSNSSSMPNENFNSTVAAYQTSNNRRGEMTPTPNRTRAMCNPFQNQTQNQAASRDTIEHRAASPLMSTTRLPPLIPPISLPIRKLDGYEVDPVYKNRRFLYHPNWVTVVLDLDETLCSNRIPGYSSLRPGAVELLQTLEIMRDGGDLSRVPKTLRKTFTGIPLNEIHKFCKVEVILWTASIDSVASDIVKLLDKSGKAFDHLIFRDPSWYSQPGDAQNTCFTGGGSQAQCNNNMQSIAKDLRRLGRPVDHVVIVENCPLSVRLNPGNAILVPDFFWSEHPQNIKEGTDCNLDLVAKLLVDWVSLIAEDTQFQIHSQIKTSVKAMMKTGNDEKKLLFNANSKYEVLPNKLGIKDFLSATPFINKKNELCNLNSFLLGLKNN